MPSDPTHLRQVKQTLPLQEQLGDDTTCREDVLQIMHLGLVKGMLPHGGEAVF